MVFWLSSFLQALADSPPHEQTTPSATDSREQNLAPCERSPAARLTRTKESYRPPPAPSPGSPKRTESGTLPSAGLHHTNSGRSSPEPNLRSPGTSDCPLLRANEPHKSASSVRSPSGEGESDLRASAA
ncbi:hypothetical protein IEQ34_022523 [Dendrobium chrysotoxum]|uniref:Uncharacterized protein n=1 Tax=Dendrobium chrysotoxum TaxID=161865 RepID=A0AAV7FZ42_DENCH|nr:hypothetical protein IEQ34_022523 [Dendrobium chrysotoxum]